MEAKGYEERVKVYLRIVGDGTIQQYPQTLSSVSRTVVRFANSSQAATANVAMCPEGFLSRNRLAHTPPKTEAQKASEDARPDVCDPPQASEFVFDYVFEPSDSLEYLQSYLALEAGELRCVVSIGRADTVTGTEGLAVEFLRKVFEMGGEVTIGCVAFSGERVTNYLTETYEKAQSLQQVLTHRGLCDFFQGKKAKDAITVFSVFRSAMGVTTGAQFVDAPSNSKALSLLCQVITNSDVSSDFRVIAKSRLFDVLRKTLCCDSRITVIGNAYPVEPHNENTEWVLKTTAEVMATRARAVTFTVHLLLKTIEKLEGETQRIGRIAEERAKVYKEEKDALIAESETLKESLKVAIIREGSQESDFSTRIRRSEQELNDLKNLLMLRETELMECKARVRELETDISHKRQGIASQFAGMSQSAEETLARLQRENEDLRRKGVELEVTINGLKACLQSRAGKRNEYIQIDPSPEKGVNLAIFRTSSVNISPEKAAKNDEIGFLTDKLRVVEGELQRVKSLPASSGSTEDLSQSRVLYNLLAECWRYTDTALRSMKEQFDKMVAVMEFKVADRELKIAYLEHRIKNMDSIHRKALEELETAKHQQTFDQDKVTTYIKQLEDNVSEARTTIAALETQKKRMMEEFSSKMREMKENYKKTIKEAKAAAKTTRNDSETEDMQTLVRRLQAEVEEKTEELVMDRERALRERKELEGQIAALKDLRKPLGAANRSYANEPNAGFIIPAMAESLLHSESEVKADALCQVCFKRDDAYNNLIKPDQRNFLHHCRGCLLAVHKLCYGLSGDTDRMFFCERCCEVGPMATQTCCVCGGVNGAMKRVGDVWVHVTCGLFSPDFKVRSFKEMRFELLSDIGKRQPLDCLICGRTSTDVLHCQSCNSGAHAICAFSSESASWDSCSLYAGQRQLVCPEHYNLNKAYCICKRSFPDKEVFMICCDVCDTWYHGECVGLPQHVGATLEKYTCGLCRAWLDIRSKLLKEDRGGTLVKVTVPEHLINLSLVDYLLVARIFENRANRYLKTPCTPEDLRDLLSLSKIFFFSHPFVDPIQEKSTAALQLVSSAQDLFQKAKEDRIDSADLPAIAALTENCSRLGLVLPQLVKLKALLEHVELIGKVKEFVGSTQVHSLVEAKAFYETIKERLGADSQWLVPLTAVINCADLWIADVKEAFAKSQNGEQKLTVEEAKKLLADGKTLTLSLPQELRTVDEEIKAAELWDKNFRALSRPYDPSQLSQLFDETNVTTVWTGSMAEAKTILDRYNFWYGQALRYMNPTEITVLPTLEEVQKHIRKGEVELSSQVDIREAKKQLEAMLNDALSWQETARAALQGPSTQQRMSFLLREGKALICSFSEMEAIERRAGINKKISDVLHRKHKEEDLLLLLREAKELCADEEFIRAVEGKLEAANEVKSRVIALLQSDLVDPAESYTQLLEELKNSRTDLPDERAKLEDGFKSLKWLQTVKDTLEDTEDLKDPIKLKRKSTDLETYKSLINKGLKVTYKHPRAAALFDQLAAKYWDLEYQKLNSSSEVTLDQLQSLEAKMTLVTHDPPESLVDFAHRIKGINKAVQYFDTLLSLPLEQIFESDLTVLKEQITLNRKKLMDEGVVFPEKFTKILPWTEWVDWCLEVQQILASDEKPSVNKLYEVNEEAINLSIPLEVSALKELTEHISYYEKWLSRYSAYIVIKKYYKGLQVVPAAYLRKFQEKPKTSLASLQQLVEQAQSLKCKCDEEIAVLSTDITEALAWVEKIKEYLKRHPYEDLLLTCKRSISRASESEAFQELQRLTHDYLFSIFVDIEDYTNRLCTYSWNLTALQLLQQTKKINAEEWDEFFANLEFGNKEYQDQITFDRVRRQQSLRLQIEEDISKLMQAEKEGGSRQLSLDDINQLNEQVMACKVMLKQDSYIQDLMQRAQELIQRFQNLQEAKGWLADFKELQSDLGKLPIEIPDISQKLKEVIDKSTSLGLRFKILKESAVQTRSKIERFKVENILKEYGEAPAKVPEAEQFAESLEQAKLVLQEGQKATDSTSLDLVTHTLSRLDLMIIHMGPAETSLRMVLWKLKVKLALEGHTKLPFQMLCGWYNEGLQMKELDTLQEIGELERWVKKGEEMKTKLAAAESLEALERVTAEARDLPLDLTQSIIEQRTRITLMGSQMPVPHHDQPQPKSTIAIAPLDDYVGESAYLPSKRIKNPNVQDPYYYGGLGKDSNPAKDPMRSSAISAIENVLAGESSLSAGLARKFALKIEGILSSTKSQGKDYNKAVANIQRVLDRLQDFEGFGEKLVARDIKCHRLCELHLSHLRNAQVVEELFGEIPKVLIRVNMTKLKSTEPPAGAPVKKPKTAQPAEKKPATAKKSSSNFQDILKNIRKGKKPVSPSSLAPSQPSARPVQSSSHSLKDLINDFKQFKEQQGENLFSKPKEPEVRETTVADLRKTDPNVEYKQLSQYRLERAGFPKQEAGFEPKKRHGDGLLEDPVKRSRHEEVPEGRFSSDSEDLPELKSTNPAEKSEEYSVLDYAHRDSSRRGKKRKGKMYDPLQSSTPKNKAPSGSLLKVWTGKIEYNKTSMIVDMFSIDSIEQFQHIPQLPQRLEIQGRTKQDELETYLTQSAGAGTHKSIITAWLEAGPAYEGPFRIMSRDLAEKDRAAVIRNDSALSIYITCLSDSFKTALNSLKINILQKVDRSVSAHISDKEKLACILVFKKSAAGPSSSLLDPTVLVPADASRAPDADDDRPQDQPLSPITSEEEDENDDSKIVLNFISKLQNGEKLELDDLNQLKLILEQNPSPEMSNLIETINEQIEQSRPREVEQRAENNVAQFLSQQHGSARPQSRSYGYDQRRSSRFS